MEKWKTTATVKMKYQGEAGLVLFVRKWLLFQQLIYWD